MKSVAILPNLEKPESVEALAQLSPWLRKRHLEVRVPLGLPVKFTCEVTLLPEDELLRGVDLLIVLGGDGTLLAAARLAYRSRVPILGVNFGRLGFLTDVSIDDMFPLLEEVLAGRFRREPRILLRAEVYDPDGEMIAQDLGLNDVVVREVGGRSIEVQTSIDGTPVHSFRGDGLIVATPTGSTAYSLSAGGPVVEPSLKALMATAICPHTFSVRPLLFPLHQTIEIGFVSRGNRVNVSVDGQLMLELKADQKVRVRRAPRPIHFVLVENRSFYAVLRTKLGWGGA